MEVHQRPTRDGSTAFFIVCDKRADISRVPVPKAKLVQLTASVSAVGELVARLLNVAYVSKSTGERYEVGHLRGRKHSGHVVLVADGTLRLELAGHVVALSDLLTLDGTSFQLNRPSLLRMVDAPRSTGDVESARRRKERLARLVNAEKRMGNDAFLKTVAASEGISVSRLKQILQSSAGRPPKALPISKMRNHQH